MNNGWTDSDFLPIPAWPTGMGLFSAGETTVYPFPFNNLLTAMPAGGPRTDYFRTTFTWAGPTTDIVFTGRAWVDDGIIIYLNGVEVFRFNMGDPAAINYALGTLTCNFDPGTANPGGEPVEEVVEFSPPPGVLQVGNNILAVELHQAGGNSSDKVFGLELSASQVIAPEITTQPVGADVIEGEPFTLTVVATGVPAPTYQWQLDTGTGFLDIAGATDATYEVTAADATLDAGDYRVVVTNSEGSDTSDVVTVTVAEDLTPPAFVSGQVLSDGSVSLTFNENLDATYMGNGFDPFNIYFFQRGNMEEPYAGILSGSTTAPDTITLTTTPPLITTEPFDVFIANNAVRDLFGNNYVGDPVNQGDFFPLNVELELLPCAGTWRYEASIPALDLFSTTPPFYDPAFDDSGWLSGAGAFGTEANALGGGAVINTPIPNPGAGGPLTLYFRHKLSLPVTKDKILSIQMFAVFDDGAVLNLNGVEYQRFSMPAGPVTVDTRAISHESNVEEGPFDIDVADLNEGDNYLAVSSHSVDTTSSDQIWALRIVAVVSEPPTPELPVITRQPVSPGTINERDGFVLSVEATGSPAPTYQWRLNGTDIMGATSSSYSVASANQPTHQGSYDCVASNTEGSDISDAVVVMVVPDTVAPTVVSAVAKLDPTEIVIVFSEDVDETQAETTGNYGVQLRAGGGALTITAATLSGGDTVTLTTSAREFDNYELSISGIDDLAFVPNTIVPVTIDLPTEVLLSEATDHTWTYNDTGADLGLALDPGGWGTAGYDDSAWPTGTSSFYNRTPGDGSNDGVLVEPIRTRVDLFTDADPAIRIITYYFRSTVNIADDPAMVPVQFQMIVDDGGVVYVNGQEAFRTVRMPPTGPVTAATLTTTSNGTDLDYEDPVSVPAGMLSVGDNLVAVEMHQNAATSSDIAFAFRVVGLIGTVPPTLRITSISLDAGGNVILEHNGAALGVAVTIQETSALALDPAATVWNNRAGAPHASPHNAGAAVGTRFFRAVSP